MKPLQFWFFIGSTYSYLTVMRIQKLAEAQGVALEWRPFDVRVIMLEMDNIPFRTKPVKAAYMWRDMERRAQGRDLPIQVPAPYPLDEADLANQIALLALEEGWGQDYVFETYKAWFQDGIPPGTATALDAVLPALGQDVERVRALAGAKAGELAQATDEARAKGIFGAPTFVTQDGEVFWGDDRLEDAIAWHKAAG